MLTRHKTEAFTLIELLVVIAVIAILMAILLPALNAAKKLATSSVCMGNHKNLLTAWILYSDDNDGWLVANGACYETASDNSPWVHGPRDIAGNKLPNSPAPPTVTEEDRYRGIMTGTLWRYIKDVDAYHCPGDNRRSTRRAPRDCYRSYSISYAFGQRSVSTPGNRGYHYYLKAADIANSAQYYVFVEEEHNGSRYGENEGGWHLPRSSSVNRLEMPSTWTFYDPLASYHIKSSTFGFADGHADRQKWRDRRTLDFITRNAEDPSSHSGITTSSPDNQDLKWLLEHFIERKRLK